MNRSNKLLLLAAAAWLVMGVTSSFAQALPDLGPDESYLMADPFSLSYQTLSQMAHPGQIQLNAPLNEGSVLPNYAVISVGPNASIKVNSGPITGNVLLGDGTTSSSSGGNNGKVTGHVDVSPTVSGDNLVHIQNAPTVVTVASSIGVQ